MARNSIQNANASLYLPNGSYSSSTAIAGLSAGFTFGCWFKITTINAICRIMSNSEAGSTISTMGINGTGGNTALRAGYYNGSSYIGARSSSMLSPGQWYHGVYTFDGTNGNIYINGVLDNASTNSPSGSSTTSLRIGDALNGLRGNVSRAVVYNRAVTAEEVALIYAGNIPTSGLQANYPLSEGAGTIAYDTSGNANNGTITLPTWTRDAPSKTRKTVNGNLVYNGDFEIAPVVNVAQTTASSNWLDGTSAGSTTNNTFGWRKFNYTGSQHAYFDSTEKYSGQYSLRLSTLGTGATIGVTNTTSATLDPFTSIPCTPSTAYTLKFWMKTNVVSGSATSGAFLRLSAGNVSDSTKIKTTTDWTQYTVTVTTGAAISTINIEARIIGNDGTATLIMDAWFDDITLTPTTATTRTAISGPYRRTVENLVANGDFEYAPPFTAATTVFPVWINGTAGGSNASRIYNWGIINETGSGQAQFDNAQNYSGTYSLKVSTTATGSLFRCTNTLTGRDFVDCAVLPSTSYTVSYFMKTTAISGSATSGAGLDAREWNGAGASGATNVIGTPVTTTTDWTKYSATFTTASTARFIQIRPQVIGNDGTGTLIMDAWFDDIVLTKTTPDARSAA